MDGGNTGQPLPGRPNDHRACALAILCLDEVEGIERVSSPKLFRRKDADLVVADENAHRRIGSANDDDPVISGPLELAAKVPPKVGASEPRIRPSLRAKGAHAGPT